MNLDEIFGGVKFMTSNNWLDFGGDSDVDTGIFDRMRYNGNSTNFTDNCKKLSTNAVSF